ncbi:hypothetical protein [Acidithiobacillus sp.]|uniref:hypothetical protein n=1 Tax=Acidithiobacillus sp. TaxID=1872118 RepID=UPI002583595A|nr:hypothetical protein [Acidithiobacillus sp.]
MLPEPHPEFDSLEHFESALDIGKGFVTGQGNELLATHSGQLCRLCNTDLLP